ncbi:CLUMA_CG007616, isoform A [Clunio marinus]|uniref:CLUMA_CG007616, isoform A n=1 Tax=Clunio marinus TaxID=568069 RepID=A0A1J1I1D8_9DIPT|nr:CLUMA_CG007616, isoform A [Clunio marinus]
MNEMDDNEADIDVILIILTTSLGQIEKQRYDGYYNNLAHPDWGAIGELYNYEYKNKIAFNLTLNDLPFFSSSRCIRIH